MKATLSWIKEFVDVEMDPKDLSDRLTNIGLECSVGLEGVLDGVVIGQITEIAPHPKADHLKVCKVATGSQVFSVVCGAPNTKLMSKTPLALVGSRLPDGKEIGSAEIQGVKSEGMLCSEAELRVGEDASGLWILPEELPVGKPLDEAMPLKDWVLEFDLTPNRSDCLSILGLAHEVAVITGSRVKIPSVTLAEEGVPIHERFEVTIHDPDLCPRYVARLVEGTRVRQSPLWMRRRLQLVGLRPINNLVDVTNYVMWELGQPLHAFDLDLLEEARITVQRAKHGERFVSLDGEERSLNSEMLMIWDGVKPVAIAGVMGGENSEVRLDSRNILIESAHFSSRSIRRTSRKLGMNTEASRRFERGIDPEGCVRAASRAAQLISELGGGTVAPGCIDAHPGAPRHIPISLRPSKVDELLGTRLERDEVESILRRLAFRLTEGDDGALRVLPPTRRVDLTREVDLIEEVARVWGFNRIPATLPKTVTVAAPPSHDTRAEWMVRKALIETGFHEIITYAFIDEAGFDSLDIPEEHPLRNLLALENPIRQDQRVMRTTLLYGMLDTVRRNLHRKNRDLRLFELGRVFIPREGEDLPVEPRRLTAVMTGARHPEYWGEREQSEVDFFDLKGVVDRLVGVLQISAVRYVSENTPPFLRDGFSACIWSAGQMLGWLGELNESVRARWDISAPTLVFESDFELLLKSSRLEQRFRSIPRYPAVVRDLSILVDHEIQAGDIMEGIQRSDVQWLDEVRLLDVFTEGRQIPQGQKSLTFRIVYRSGVRSLTDEEVNDQHRGLIQSIEKRFKTRLRS